MELQDVQELANFFERRHFHFDHLFFQAFESLQLKHDIVLIGIEAVLVETRIIIEIVSGFVVLL